VIVIDTNVLSELLRPAPEPTVLAWVARYSPQPLLERKSFTASP
jgi:predicted nucleic acid-binding protein